MTQIGSAASRLLRSTALVTCSLGALLAAPAVSQASGSITPYYGSLHPFYGSLHPFYGSLHPFSADVSTTYGDVTPFYGSLHPFYGSLHPFTANTPGASTTDDAFYAATMSNAYWGQGAFNPFTWVPKAGAANQVGPLNVVQFSQIGGFWSNQTSAWLPLWQTWQSAQDNSASAIAAANSATASATAAAASAASASASATAAVQAAAAQTDAAKNASDAARDATDKAKTAAQKTAAANQTAAAASATAAAASATAAAKNAQTAAASATASANNQVLAANAQTKSAYAPIQSVSANLQSLFFGAGGAANSPTASLATFWAAEIASRPKGPWGAINGVSQNYNRIVSNEIYKVLKPYGAVLTLDASGVPVIDLTSTANVKALAQATAGDQAQIYSNIYDRMMDYSGTNHVDWWMGAANWTPSLARVQMGGTASTTNYATLVGMIDYTVNGSGQHNGGDQGEQNPNNGNGSGGVTNGHGAAVYSLIKGAPVAASWQSGCSLDQTQANYCPGVAGVAQTNTYVFVYDPYDSTGSTSFTPDSSGSQYNVGDAVTKLVYANKTDGYNVQHPLGVINASLGVSGWTLNSGWNDALKYATSKGARNTYVLVVAAGNDGSTQTVNVPWTYATNPSLLVVGSIGADGTISSFSNRPGEACLYDTASKNTATSACVESTKLKNRFIVAPGESILVSDGNGSTTRVTGTSLAAPLVAGTVALIDGRWNWLAPQYVRGVLNTGAPDVVSKIILQSATPLGTRAQPGGVADPVYGMGALNITAANSPLDYNSLFYQTTQTVSGTTSSTWTPIATVKATVKGGAQTTFNSTNLFVSAFEYFDANANLITPSGTGVSKDSDTAKKTAIDTATLNKRYRDFQIPVASTLVGQRVGGQGQYFEDYLASGLTAWAKSSFANTSVHNAGMTGFMQTSVPAGQMMGMDVRLKMTDATPTYGYRQGNMPIRTEMALIGHNSTVRLGFGSGAAALDSSNGFDSAKDYDVTRGGANPLLGLASGGGFVDYRTQLMNGVALNVGITQRRDVRDPNAFGMTSGVASGASAYEANAEHIGADISVHRNLMVHTALTVLRENTGLLGVQSLNQGDLRGGSTSKGVTLGFDWNVLPDVTLTASGTLANTRAAGGQSLITGAGGINSSAGEIALSKFGLFSNTDRLRLTLNRPMQVDSGRIHYQTVAVVDRLTGDLGLIDQSTSAATQKRPLSAEALYGVTLPRQSAEIQMFVRAEANDQQATALKPMNYTAGGRYRIAF